MIVSAIKTEQGKLQFKIRVLWPQEECLNVCRKTQRVLNEHLLPAKCSAEEKKLGETVSALKECITTGWDIINGQVRSLHSAEWWVPEEHGAHREAEAGAAAPTDSVICLGWPRRRARGLDWCSSSSQTLTLNPGHLAVFLHYFLVKT